MLLPLLVVAAVGLVHAEDRAVAALRTEVQVETLPNGLTLVVAEDHRAPLLASVVLLDAGAGDEEPPRSGVAHLFEHLMFEGTPSVPGQGYDLALAEAGGDNNAWTDHDATVFHAVVPVGAVDRLLFLEADRLTGVSQGLTHQSLDNQLAVVRAEASLTDDSPHVRDLDALLAAVYGSGHPYGAPVHGDPELRRHLTLSEVSTWATRATHPARVTVALVGALERADLLRRARAVFGGLSAPPLVEEAPSPPPPPRLGRWSFSGASRQDTLYFAWPLDPGSPSDLAAATLLGRGLVGSGQGPLARALPRHSVTTWTWRGERGGLFVVQMQGSGRLDEFEARLAKAWPAAVAAVVADPAWLTREQKVYRLAHLRGLEDPLARAESLALCVAQGHPPGCDAEALAHALAVTPSALARAGEVLTVESVSVVGVADTEAHGLAAPLLEFWP